MLYRRGELLRLAKPERSIAGILAKEFKLSVRQVQNILRDALGRY